MIYCKLPTDIASRRVLLMDPMIGTGATAMMAIRVLLDHNVPEENIIFLSLMAAPTGLHTIAYAFPAAQIAVTSVSDAVSDHYFILPGVGNFGDRYFGTDESGHFEEDEGPDILILPPPAI
jgi:uridine kinase